MSAHERLGPVWDAARQELERAEGAARSCPCPETDWMLRQALTRVEQLRPWIERGR
ncbi:hypothetical protein BACT_1094 [Bifidobacterium actinocoloniiforme DSM 22766]|uniref:Uncharacterized protein n=1 Tax=Bifidobacterium actinocoloniiforme DSM 22766 TaxID=1437605 RepID=A0A086Z1J2_9BIFI|nr:hypothetical protein BACT_1094 [Bifidobacterium actinocoloniiforme DSM 22766]